MALWLGNRHPYQRCRCSHRSCVLHTSDKSICTWWHSSCTRQSSSNAIWRSSRPHGKRWDSWAPWASICTAHRTDYNWADRSPQDMHSACMHCPVTSCSPDTDYTPRCHFGVCKCPMDMLKQKPRIKINFFFYFDKSSVLCHCSPIGRRNSNSRATLSLFQHTIKYYVIVIKSLMTHSRLRYLIKNRIEYFAFSHAHNIN